jgi:hypothetical protein
MYQQIGYIYRQLSDHEEALKQFKKMLQLSWNEGDEGMELAAYE